MFNLGPEKLVVLALVALVVLGPNRLPEAARKAGKVLRDLRELSARLQAEVQQAFEEHTGTSAVEAIDTLRSITGGPLGPARSGLNAALAAVSAQTTQLPAANADADADSSVDAPDVKQRPSTKKPGPVRKKAPAKPAPRTRTSVAAKGATPKRVATAKTNSPASAPAATRVRKATAAPTRAPAAKKTTARSAAKRAAGIRPH